MLIQRSNRLTRIVVLATCVVLAGITFFAGAWYGYEQRPAVEKVLSVLGQRQPEQFEQVDFNLFWDVWSRIEDKYVDKSNIDREKLVFGAIRGMVASLKDPYTEFFPPAETKQFQEDVRGEFDGIGAEIGLRKNVLTIIAPLKKSPAEQAGLKAGDKIFKIDDTVSTDLQLDEAVRLIRGKKGTTVRLLVFRDSFNKAQEFKITRDTIQVQVFETERVPGGIFVIKLHHFSENANVEFKKAVQEFLASGSQKLILDLRNNPGGYLNVSVDIASWFLDSGETVVRERFADGSEELHRSQGYRILKDTPTVVLINEGSASASEIVAGALRDLKKIKLIGAKTFGKGSVQEVVNLERKSSLKITIAKWLTPSGVEINGRGLEPDVPVEIPSDNDPAQDPVLEKGIEVLKAVNQ